MLFAGSTVLHRPARHLGPRRQLPEAAFGGRLRLTVVFTVLAAVTLLPALLGVFGMRVLSRRQRLRCGGRPPGANTLGTLGGTVERRPAILAVAAAAVMLVLAIPC